MSLKTIIKRSLPLLPSFVQRFLRSRIATRREREKIARRERTRVVASDILTQLADLRLDGDFMVHGSISNIGKFDKPVGEFVSAWLHQLDLQRQTVLVPALPYNTTMREYLEGQTQFDVRNAKNAMGAISNIVMAAPGAMRSLHPTHSVVALGANASFYVTGHETDVTPFGPNSPYRKLVERRGNILMFGVGLNSVTCFHVYEDMLGIDMPFPVYLDRKFTIPCVGISGETLSVTTTCHDPNISAVRECERARSALTRAGAITSYPLGESELSIVDARLFTITLLEMLAEGQSIYGPVVVNSKLRVRISECLESLS